MEEDELRKLLAFAKRTFVERGLTGIAEDQNYIEDDGDDRDLPSSREQIISMLEAFERHLAARDRRTAEEGLEQIRRSSDSPNVLAAVVSRPHRTGSEVDAPPRNLTSGPNLLRLRERVRRLVADLTETPDDFDRGGR